MNELPTFVAASYADALPVAGAWENMRHANKTWPGMEPRHDLVHEMGHALQAQILPKRKPQPPETPTMTQETASRRLVRVLVVDPDEQIPTEMALLYDSKEMFTDLTDQELFFAMTVSSLLATHNEKRTKIVNKTIKDRTEHLEPARIRDLKMLVLTLAKF